MAALWKDARAREWANLGERPLTLHLMFFLLLCATSAQKGRGLRIPWKGNAQTVLLEGKSSVYKYASQLLPCGPCPAAADSGQTLWPSEVGAE